jgi:hypothetical protein
MFGREVKAPVDILFGVPVEEETSWECVDDFVQEKITSMRESYDLVRKQLGESLEKSKKNYDMKAKNTTYHVGQWVWHYCPRRYIQRSPKWQRLYDGPYLITRRINEVNYVVQKTQRSNPFVTHVDKMKLCRRQDWPSWLPNTGSEEIEEARSTMKPIPVHRGRRTRKPVPEEVEEQERLIRPRREVSRPSRFDDYV